MFKSFSVFVFFHFLLIISTNKLFAQSADFLWAKQMGGTGDDQGKSMAVDAAGNVYTTGSFTGTADFDPGPGTYNMTSLGGTDVFISKMDASGNFIWAKQMWSASNITSYAICTDNNGNVYTTGNFGGVVDFDPGLQNFYMTASFNADIFISKLNTNGEFVWAKQIGTSGSGVGIHSARSIQVDQYGNIYVKGYFVGTSDFDPGDGVLLMTGNYATFIIKLDVSGNFSWAIQIGGVEPSKYNFGNSICVDKYGNVYATGHFKGTVDFDPGQGVYNLTASGITNNIDAYVSKLDAAGNFIWAKQFSGVGDQQGNAISVDEQGNVYTTGYFGSPTDFDPGPASYNLFPASANTGFVTKLDFSGNFKWASQFGNPYGYEGKSIFVMDSENIFITGSFTGTTYFQTIVLTGQQLDVFVAKLNMTGNFLWAKKIGGIGSNVSNAIALDPSGNIYTAGNFSGTADFDPGPAINNLTTAGSNDVFVVKLKSEHFSNTVPQITLSKAIVPISQTMVIQGQGFTANKAVNLFFSGSGGTYNNRVMANASGAINFTYSIPANAQSGHCYVKAYDSATATYSAPIKNFEIQLTAPNTAVDYLTITSPNQGYSIEAGKPIYVLWQDKLQRKYGNAYYPMLSGGTYRKYRYTIEYQVGSSGTWQYADTLSGAGRLDTDVSFFKAIQINTPDNNCRIRITDNLMPAIVKTTAAFAMATVPSNIKPELVWDKSFPQPYISPQGVAADGVARLYLKVSKKNQGVGPNIEQVKVTLSNGILTTTNMLGKLKPATILDAYTTEANDANALTATSSTNVSDAFWFWYVAPDDFSENKNSIYVDSSERTVKAHVVATFTNGTKDSTDFAVKIVRPPLVMAHGVAGNADSWSKFNYDNNVLFINSPLLKLRRAITLDPSASYYKNGELLLSHGGGNGNTSLQDNIYDMRWLGYACNQVDYVCHSMGGCVLRTAINVFPMKYFGTSPNEKYHNYEKGFVHKAITINTPHNGSPVADGATEFIPEATDVMNASLKALYNSGVNIPLVFDLIRPLNPNNFFSSWETVPAVKNLQVSANAGGKKFGTTTVKNHLIAGDVDLLSTQTTAVLAELDPYLDVIEKVLKIMHKLTLPPVKNTLKTFINLTKGARALTFIEWYSSQKGFPNFLGDGDIVVPLASQLAGLSVNSPNVKVFKNTSSGNSFHIGMQHRNDVGNWVKELLNTRLDSNLFAGVIPSSGTQNGNSAVRANIPTISSSQLLDVFDTSKVEITAPGRNMLFNTDSIINIQFKLKDTVKLAYVDIVFQTQTNTSLSKANKQIIKTQVDPSFIGDQVIYVSAVYDKDSVTETYTDTLTVKVSSNAQFLELRSSPEVLDVQRGRSYPLEYTGVYNTVIAKISSNDTALKVSIADTNVVKYDSVLHAFKSVVDSGSTYAVIRYKGLSDTSYFYSYPPLYSGCVNRSITNGNWKNPAVWEKGMVPNSCDSVVVMPGHNIYFDTSTQIRALYISNGATVTVNDSAMSLQVGEPDLGNSTVINDGSLLISKGKFKINGFLQQNAGSNFNMNGGELIIDGNTGFGATSVPNGIHLFDASTAMGSFNFSGGTLQIIDPPLGNQSQSIKCSYNFGSNSILKLGDGLSTTFSNNPNGFGGNLLPSQIGKLIFDPATATNNRIFININPLTVSSPLQVKSGNLVQGALLWVIQ